jgi:uncharacterized protein involved in exopolysaccharide biosynthesis
MSGHAHLWVCTGNNIGRLYTLDHPEQTIGRQGGGAQLEIDDERVSSMHCQIVLSHGRHLLRDLGSTNGTYVNHQQVAEAFLSDGDLIQCGETIFEYVSDRVTLEIGRTAPGSESVPRGIRDSAQQALHRARVGEQRGGSASPETQGRRMLPPGPEVPVQYQPPYVGYAPHPHAPPPGLPPEYHAHLSAAEDDEELNLKELFAQAQKVLQFFLPYWRSIVAITCCFMVAGAASYFIKPPPRKAVFEVSLRPDTAQNPVVPYNRQDVGFFTSAEQNFRALPLIERTLRALGEQDVSAERMAEIQKNLEFFVVGVPKPNGPVTYQGVFVDRDPEWSVRFLKEHFEIYLETEIDKTLKKIRLEAEFLTKRLDDAEKELRRTETALLEFKKENIDGLPEQARQYYDYLFQLRTQQSAAAMAAARLKAEVGLDKQRLGDEKALVEDKIVMSQPYQAAMVDATRQLADLKAQGKGPEHPQVIALEQSIAELKALAEKAKDDPIIEQRRNPLHDTFKKALVEREVSARIAGQEAARVQKDLRRVEEIVARLPDLEAEYAELNRTYDATKKLHTQIFETLQTTKMQLDLERASIKSRYDIIAPPNLEFISARKKIMNRAVSSGGVGFVVALLVTALRQLKRMHKAGLLNKKTPRSAPNVKALSLRQQ